MNSVPTNILGSNGADLAFRMSTRDVTVVVEWRSIMATACHECSLKACKGNKGRVVEVAHMSLDKLI